MERKRPTYDLAAIKAVLGAVDSLAITSSAFRDALSLGFDRAGIAAVIQGMDRKKNVRQVDDDDQGFQADIVTDFTIMSFKES